MCRHERRAGDGLAAVTLSGAAGAGSVGGQGGAGGRGGR